MYERIITYCANRHLPVNLVLIAVIIGGIMAWHRTSKEDMPSVTFDSVFISVGYPGATAGDVEHFIARPIEEKIHGLDGVYRITSTCSSGRVSIRVELEHGYPDMDEAIMEIRNTVLDVNLPDGVVDDPRVRVFKTSRRAIVDIALYLKSVHMLDNSSRRRLQNYALALENRFMSLAQVNSVNRRGYLQEELQIKIHPDKLAKFEIPFNAVRREIRNNHIRQPAGELDSEGAPKVTLMAELDSVKKLRDLIIQGGFEGQVIRLGEVADVEMGYEKNNSVMKINGREAVMLNVVKTGSHGILKSLDAVRGVLEDFKKNNLKGTDVEAILMDDESIDVRNRLSLISLNGAIGFVLILAMLFTFLNFRAGIWVALGIPFSLCFTMMGVSFLGYTINGTTLAAVIILLGIVVDDAIIVAENITRELHQGTAPAIAVSRGTSFVLLPITAGIATTCMAFVPFFFFTGHFGRFIEFIPPVIFLMLTASLFESIFILPGHMSLGLKSRFRGVDGSLPSPEAQSAGNGAAHWFDRVEEAYGNVLERVLRFKWLVFLGLGLVLILSWFVASRKMKFMMFPREETRNIVLSGMTPKGTTRYDTARMTRPIEDIIMAELGKDLVGLRTGIARSHHGGAVLENRFRISVEILPREKRKRSANSIIAGLKSKLTGLKGFSKLTFSKSHWGQSSGSPIEIIVQQNDDESRRAIVQELIDRMSALPALKNVEVDESVFLPEYHIELDREKIKRLSINPADVAATFRAALEGIILYDFSSGDEDIRVRLTTVDGIKTDIKNVLAIPVENARNYLVPLGDVVRVKKVTAPNSISRRDMKRTRLVYADIREDSGITPVEVAQDLEANVFPDILSRYPTTTLSFGGEVKDTRESKTDFRNAVILALFLIYAILAVLFNSLLKPLLIMLVIPFGVVGIILAFYLHGKVLFGFYAAVGTLGLAGVVVNDSIIMLFKLDDRFDRNAPRSAIIRQVAAIARTRLRAVLLTTVTTVAGVMPAAYGLAGYDAMLSDMMLALAWGLIFGTVITLVLLPCLYVLVQELRSKPAGEGVVV